jgi:hypothetical protein
MISVRKVALWNKNVKTTLQEEVLAENIYKPSGIARKIF